MKKKNNHKQKNSSERNAYGRYIKQRNYEPTMDEALEFDESANSEAYYSTQNSGSSRKRKFNDQFKDHFTENYMNWLFGLALFIGVYMIFDSKLNFAVLFERTDQMSNKIDKIESKQIHQNSQIQEQNLKIQKNALKIEYSAQNNNKKK